MNPAQKGVILRLQPRSRVYAKEDVRHASCDAMTPGAVPCVSPPQAFPGHVLYASVLVVRRTRSAEVCLATGNHGKRAMAGLNVRDPAVDRSLRSVFGKRNYCCQESGRDRKEAGNSEERPLHLLNRFGNR